MNEEAESLDYVWSRPYESLTDLDFEFIDECDSFNLARLAKRAHFNADNERTVLLAEKLLKREPNNLKAWLYIAVVYERTGRFEEAYEIYVDHVTRLEGSTQDNRKIMRRLKLKMEGRHFPKSYKSLTNADWERISVADVGALIAYSIEAEAALDWEVVVRLNDEILKKEPGNITSSIRKAAALRNLNKPSEALLILEQVLKMQIRANLSIARTTTNILQLRQQLGINDVGELAASVRKSVHELTGSK